MLFLDKHLLNSPSLDNYVLYPSTRRIYVCFRIGTTLACFHDDGTFASGNVRLMVSVTTGASWSAFSFNSHLRILSGPDVFEGLSAESFFKTQNSLAKGRVFMHRYHCVKDDEYCLVCGVLNSQSCTDNIRT